MRVPHLHSRTYPNLIISLINQRFHKKSEQYIMPKYIFAYHGGSMPETEAERQEVMNAWGAWMGSIGDNLVDGGNPAGGSKTVSAGGNVADDGGANPISGYSLVNAADIDAAVAIAKACPILDGGGTVEVAEAIEMDM